MVSVICQLDTNLESSGKSEPPLKNCRDQIGLWPICEAFSSLLIVEGGSSPWWVGSAIPRKMDIDCTRNQAGPAMGSQSLNGTPLWRLLQYLVPGFCLLHLSWLLQM